MQRRASSLQPEMSRAIQRAFQAIRDRLSDAEILRAIQSKWIDTLFEKELSDAMMQQAFQPVRNVMRESVNKGVLYFAKDLPVPKSRATNFAFDSLSPDVVTAIQTLESRVITDLGESIRETVRQRIARGIVEGESPSSIARDLRSVIGMSASQEESVRNYEQQLRDGNKQALERKLRDKRYDSITKKGDLSEEQVGRMTDAYRRKMIAHNSDTVARTAVLDAQKLGQQLSIDRAVSQGILDGERMQKVWVGVMDERERDEHVAMEGETVPYDELYSNGEDIPGESTYNCRCISRFTLGTQ